jgi:hypothetical protein
VVERYLDCGNPRCGFARIRRIDDSRLAEIFAREVLADLVRKELLSPEWAERLLSWRHTGFNVHSQVRAKTKPEAERVGKYMIRLIFVADRPPPTHLAYQEVLMAAEAGSEYSS